MDVTGAANRSGWTSVRDALADEYERSAGDPLVIDSSIELLDMPAGPSARLDKALAPQSLSGRREGEVETAFAFTNGRTWYELRCWSFEPPADRWLSIAETFEFLPV